MEKVKHLIWSSDVDYEDWRDDMESEYPDLTDEERENLAYELNNEYLDDERCNLNIPLSRPILVIGDLGRWNGRVTGYKELRSKNIKDCLYSDDNYNTWFVDERGDLRGVGHHHDGTNYYLYRTYKDGVSQTQIENLHEKIYNGKATRRDITRITRRLGDEIGAVYGWTF
jgi:hypothetical protein